jgi:hypothetical protein
MVGTGSVCGFSKWYERVLGAVFAIRALVPGRAFHY